MTKFNAVIVLLYVKNAKKQDYLSDSPSLILFNSYFFHYLWLYRLVSEICCNSSDLVNYFNALNNLSECSVLTVKVRSVLVHYEELRTC